MPWYGKEYPTPFDTTPIEGMMFLVGDVLARRYKQEWIKGQKYPLITFPSNLSRELRQINSPAMDAVHLCGNLSLPYRGSRDEAYEQVTTQNMDGEYRIFKGGEGELIVVNALSGRSYQAAYNNQARQLTAIRRSPVEAMELLPGELRAILPKLYANEPQGMNAIAPIKFFTPDSNWTWYPTEFDGEDIFFGLVSGFEVELGYFSLSEIERLRGSLGLPVERDIYFSPKSLRGLKKDHNDI